MYHLFRLEFISLLAITLQEEAFNVLWGMTINYKCRCKYFLTLKLHILTCLTL